MADTKISALSAVTTPADADELAVNQGGSSKKVTLNQLTAYFEQRGRQTNASVAQQNPTGGTATYLTGSDVLIPTGRLQAKSMYRLKFDIHKTALSGTANVIVTIKIGTAGTVADTTRATVTFGVQTAVADEGAIDINVVFRTVGSGTSAVIQVLGMLDHRLAASGLTNVNTSIQKVTSSGFDSTVAGSRIGCAVDIGSGTTANINLVQAELFNLA